MTYLAWSPSWITECRHCQEESCSDVLLSFVWAQRQTSTWYSTLHYTLPSLFLSLTSLPIILDFFVFFPYFTFSHFLLLFLIFFYFLSLSTLPFHIILHSILHHSDSTFLYSYHIYDHNRWTSLLPI